MKYIGRFYAQTADDGKTYNYKFYSLAAIIAVGYRINSERAMQFRTWATKVLDLMRSCNASFKLSLFFSPSLARMFARWLVMFPLLR